MDIKKKCWQEVLGHRSNTVAPFQPEKDVWHQEQASVLQTFQMVLLYARVVHRHSPQDLLQMDWVATLYASRVRHRDMIETTEVILDVTKVNHNQFFSFQTAAFPLWRSSLREADCRISDCLIEDSCTEKVIVVIVNKQIDVHNVFSRSNSAPFHLQQFLLFQLCAIPSVTISSILPWGKAISSNQTTRVFLKNYMMILW